MLFSNNVNYTAAVRTLQLRPNFLIQDMMRGDSTIHPASAAEKGDFP
jgi:hypothetical protein